MRPSLRARIVAGPILRLIEIVARRVRVVGVDQAEAALEERRTRADGRRIVYYHWVEDVLPRLILAKHGGFRLGQDVGFVCDDTFAGHVGCALMMALGERPLPLRVAGGGALAVKDLQELIRAQSPINIAADGRGPYGRVHPGLVKLVQARAAIAIPVSVVAAPVLGSWLPGRFVVPLPGATLAVGVGPVVVVEVGGEGAAIAALEAGLGDARDVGRRLLSVA